MNATITECKTLDVRVRVAGDGYTEVMDAKGNLIGSINTTNTSRLEELGRSIGPAVWPESQAGIEGGHLDSTA